MSETEASSTAAVATIEKMDMSGLLDDERNSKSLVCQRCDSKILPSKKGQYSSENAKNLHVMHKKQEDAGIKLEKIEQFYIVEDMFDFDNVGFTKPVMVDNDVDDIKYLICADCEVGPIGWHCISTKKNYVALARIKHV
jgi:hypothetical protein